MANLTVSGEKLAVAFALLAFLHFDDFFGRHEYLTEHFAHVASVYAVFQRAFYLILKTRVGMYDVPTHIHCHDPRPIIVCTTPPSNRSSNHSSTAKIMTTIITTIVV